MSRIANQIYGPEIRKTWGPGPWQDEPDVIRWTDGATGYRCAIVRGHLGQLCGYVAVLPTHPAHGDRHKQSPVKLHPVDLPGFPTEVVPTMREYTPMWDADLCCHGGITYSRNSEPHVEGSVETEWWWFGFDCAHYLDLTPALSHLHGAGGLLDGFKGDLLDGLPEFLNGEGALTRPELRMLNGIYRDPAYVEAEVTGLVLQLWALQLQGPIAIAAPIAGPAADLASAGDPGPAGCTS